MISPRKRIMGGSTVVRYPLARRLALAIFSALIVVNLCSLFILYQVEDTKNFKSLRRQGAVLGQYIGTSIAPKLLSYDFIGVDAALDEAVYLQGVCYIAILAENEVYVAAKVAPGSCTVPTLSEPKAPTSAAGYDSLTIIKRMRAYGVDQTEVSSPILFTDHYLGRVVVGLSLGVSRKKTSEFLVVLLIVNSVMAFFLAGGIYLFFWRYAFQPIDALIAVVNKSTDGVYGKPVPVLRQDEIGVLTHSFNMMMAARKQAEAEIRKTRRDWERLFNAVEDVVTIQDKEMRIIQANSVAGRLLGKEPCELKGKHCYELFQGRTEACQGCPLVSCRQDHNYHHSELECCLKGKTFNVSAFPMYDDANVWVGIAHIARDISQQKKLEAQYRQAQKMEAIGTLAGGVAHDFNNILTPIFGYAALIKMDAAPGSILDNNIDSILHSSELAKDLVKQILTFSRERQHERQELRLQPIIKESMKLLRASIPSTIAFEITLEESCANIKADPTQIHQILMNLCTNAYHAMEEAGGVLVVGLQQIFLDNETAYLTGNLVPGDYLELKISDNGMGMDSATRERIFDPFFTTKEEGKGTGMGLAVVHGLVKEYGGWISVYSELGEGTSFTIYLPVIAEEMEGMVTSIPLKMEMIHSRSNEHILVVDDEKDIVALEQQLLERAGYLVTTMTKSEEALKLFKKNSGEFDLVITDMTMPGMTGLELAEQLLALRPDLPVVLCSGHIHTTQKEVVGQKKLIRNFIAKPINPWLLTKCVYEALEGREGNE